MSAELQLTLVPPPEAPAGLDWLEAHLDEVGRWVTAPDIVAATGGRLTDRKVRELASASDVIISGQRGYRRLERSSADEIRHFLADMESRARELMLRAARIRRRAHRIVG